MTAKRIDWEAVERDFRVSTCTKAELSALHGLRPETLSRRMARDRATDPARWARDLTAEVRRATSALLIREAVEVRIKEASREGQALASDAVLAAADQAKRVLMGHRRDAQALAGTASKLARELESATVDIELLRSLGARLGSEGLEPDEFAQLHANLCELTRLHNRVSTAQRLADTLTKLHQLERRAYGIPDDGLDESDELARLSDAELSARVDALVAKRGAARA